MADIDPDEPLFALTEEDKETLKVDDTLIHYAQTAYVSEAVRRECMKELSDAKKRGYRILK